MALQVFATPVLSFDSELMLYTETTLTRLERKVHAISSVDVHTVSKRAPDSSESSCEILVYQNS